MPKFTKTKSDKSGGSSTDMEDYSVVSKSNFSVNTIRTPPLLPQPLPQAPVFVAKDEKSDRTIEVNYQKDSSSNQKHNGGPSKEEEKEHHTRATRKKSKSHKKHDHKNYQNAMMYMLTNNSNSTKNCGADDMTGTDSLVDMSKNSENLNQYP